MLVFAEITMQLIKEEKFNREIKEQFDWRFNVSEKGLYFIEISARVKSWGQNLFQFRSFFADDDLTVSIDKINFPKLDGRRGLFDGEVAWNGNNLAGMEKIVAVLINFDVGEHIISFLPDQKPELGAVKIYRVENPARISYLPDHNNPPEDGNRRQWLTIVLVDGSLKILTIKASAKNYFPDDDDLKLIIDGAIQKNLEPKSHSDWFWCGRKLKGGEREFSQDFNIPAGLHYIELWADRMPEIKEIKIKLSEKSNYPAFVAGDIKIYTYKGVDDTDDYNRFDKEILEAVNFWNKFFFFQKYPPEQALDPNLVKAMIYAETLLGYYKVEEGHYPSYSDVMQVGNPGDPAIHTLNNDGWVSPETGEIARENEWQDGKVAVLDYKGEAKADTPAESIKWGVRWLYHKAQYVGDDGGRHWKSWEEAVNGYGPGTKYYFDRVWDAYLKGIDENKGKPQIKLWTVILFLAISVVATFSFYHRQNSLKNAIFDTLEPELRVYVKDVKAKFYAHNPSLFAAIIAQDVDWWEDLKVGDYKEGKIEWFSTKDGPTEQSILSARFLNLEGFENPLIEVYGQTHMGHGSFYLYEVKDNRVELIFQTGGAVDINSDISWQPDNHAKYGYGNCGEKYSGGKLSANYGDLDADGVSDIILGGTEEIICEEYSNGRSGDNEYITVKVADIPIKSVFLWDRSEKQIGENETDDDDLRVEIGGRKFGRLNDAYGYFDSPEKNILLKK